MEQDKYLIDTDILIDYFRRKYALRDKFSEVGLINCYVSEITIAELTYGAVKSNNQAKHNKELELVKSNLKILPISDVLDLYSEERLRLEKKGTPLPDFDLLIAVTSVKYKMILVTGNIKHHRRVRNIRIENWREKEHNEFIK